MSKCHIVGNLMPGLNYYLIENDRETMLINAVFLFYPTLAMG